MRFLIDRCAGRRLAEWLRERGHDAVESREYGADPGDLTLLHWAFAEERILVTMDKDFGALVYRKGGQHRGLVRLPDVPARERIVLMEQILDRHGHDLAAGAVVTVRGSRIRVSLPSSLPPES
ncbi:MAG TPA: DUF5615 family PIN-like protein [Solirubrobacterales bacterium]|nr:DUF5615 family PIN-like protein [Solirubrobacterales bacterium]